MWAVGHKYPRLEKRRMVMKGGRRKGIYGSLAQCSILTEEVLGIVSDLYIYIESGSSPLMKTDPVRIWIQTKLYYDKLKKKTNN